MNQTSTTQSDQRRNHEGAVDPSAPKTRKKYVMKFGGSSLRGPKEILQSTSIIRSYAQDASVVAICSALGDTTDHLVKAIELAKKGLIEDARKTIEVVRHDHEVAMEQAISNPLFAEESKAWVSARFEEIDRALLGISLLRDLSPRSLDFVLSFGERLAAFIVNSVLGSFGLKTKYLTGGEAGIVTDETFGSAEPIRSLTEEGIRRNILPLLEQEVVPVVTGYIAETYETREIITLGRGGSDYTATLIGAAIEADEVMLWTDVDGILSADPRIVKDARILGQITYLEAMEMSAFGAKAMQPRALEPVAEKGIPVRIRNTFKPEIQGTLILSPDKIVNGAGKNGVKSVGSLTGLAIVGIGGRSIVGQPGTAVKIFEILKDLEVGILMMSQSVSENNVSLVIRKEYLPKVVRAFKKQLLLENSSSGDEDKQSAGSHYYSSASSSVNSKFNRLDYEDDVSIVAVLGRGMIGTPGIAGRVFSTVAKQGINIRMIAQGSSEINISFVIKEKERNRAVIALHEEFGLGKTPESSH